MVMLAPKSVVNCPITASEICYTNIQRAHRLRNAGGLAGTRSNFILSIQVVLVLCAMNLFDLFQSSIN